ncbi:high-temperature-induced dauer-formation protein-domain-containing protein [Mortierella sp. GBAus27b]|nr:high-temperature-induced dauer-formation protein-domain-containing protein [Mortierella sp. GBAus27b]
MGAADSKLAFKKGVFRLFEERNIPPAANDYWEQFWTLPESVDDVFLLVGSQDIRRVRDEARENLECLVDKILNQLFRLCESPEFPSPHAPAIQVLNCVRVLTRVFPFVFESEDLMDWEERYFWMPRTVVVSTRKRHGSTAQASAPMVDAAASVSEIQPAPLPGDHAPNTSSQSRDKEEFLELEEKSVPSYGQRLIKTLLDLLFTSGFTLPTALETKTRVSYVIWETGVGSSKPIGTSKELDDNRTEILRLLLVLFSRSMYIPPTAVMTIENRWIDTVVTGSDRQVTLAVLCSLINSALKYNPSGWGLPYNHVMFSDQRELLVMLCLQVIVVLLDYHVIEKPHSLSTSSTSTGIRIDNQQMPGVDSTLSTSTGSTQAASVECAKNQFRYYLSRLHREQDFLFLVDGMYRILSNPMAASSTYLPGSTKQVKCHQETLMLCWKMLEVNKNTKMTHTLSKDKAFGSCMNRPFDGHASLPGNVKIQNFHGTYGDYLICSVHNLISTTKRTLRSLYPALISTLSNVSPYLKNISPLASNRLLQLTTSFASPSFLLAEESNHELLSILLDTVCTILYYQASDNPHLVYSLIQYEPKIQTMASFTLQRGLDDIHKLRYQRMEALSTRPNPATGESNNQPKGPTSTENRARRPGVSRQHSTQGSGYAESSSSSSSSNIQQQPHTHTKKLHGLKREGVSVTTGTSAAAASPASPLSFSPMLRAEDLKQEEPAIVLPTLLRPEINTDSMALLSDGGGHEGDVEDEGGPSTVLKSPKDRSSHVHGMSEKARGKLPEKHHHGSVSLVERESSCELEREGGFESIRPRRMSNSSRTASGRRHSSTTLARNLSYRQELTTTAYDVGQNGFVPTDNWVEGWMRKLRFEPLLIMLQYVIPEIEAIHAMNDHQVLEYIRSNIIPMLRQHLPESGRPHIMVRKFVWGDLVIWFEGYLWSQIYVGGGGRLGRQGLGVWYETGVRLFSIRTIPAASSSSATATAAAAAAATAVTDNMASVAAAAIRVAGFGTTAAPSSSPMPGVSSLHRSSVSSSTTGTPLSSPRGSFAERRTSIASVGSATGAGFGTRPSRSTAMMSVSTSEEGRL